MPLDLEHLSRALLRPPQRVTDPGRRVAAVAAVLTPELHLLFMRRAERPGDPWSGHLSFPGGHAEAQDPDDLATATREAREELGLELGVARVLGELDTIETHSALPQLLIRPYVFALPEEPLIKPNPEVASVHRLPLEDLLAGRGRKAMTLPWRGADYRLPCVEFDGVRLWGLTLLAVDDLLDRIDGRGRGFDRPAL